MRPMISFVKTAVAVQWQFSLQVQVAMILSAVQLFHLWIVQRDTLQVLVTSSPPNHVLEILPPCNRSRRPQFSSHLNSFDPFVTNLSIVSIVVPSKKSLSQPTS